MIWHYFTIALLCVGGCTSECALGPLELNLNAGAYDGQKVQVRGLIELGPEARWFFQSRAAFEKSTGKPDCVTLVNANMLFGHFDEYNDRMAIITGTFHKIVYPNGDVVDLAMCSESSLEVESVRLQ